MLVKEWELDDWWYRYEWQHRGSVHVHGIAKKRNAPIINWSTLKENEEEKAEVISYLDSIVTTINPGLNAAIPKRHSCQHESNDDNPASNHVLIVIPIVQ